MWRTEANLWELVLSFQHRVPGLKLTCQHVPLPAELSCCPLNYVCVCVCVGGVHECECVCVCECVYVCVCL